MSSSQTDKYLFDFSASLQHRRDPDTEAALITDHAVPTHDFYALHYQIAQFAERISEKHQLHEANLEHFRKQIGTLKWSLSICTSILHTAENNRMHVQQQKLERNKAQQTSTWLLSERKRLLEFDVTEAYKVKSETMRSWFSKLLEYQSSIQQHISGTQSGVTAIASLIPSSSSPSSPSSPLPSVHRQLQNTTARATKKIQDDAELNRLLQDEAETLFHLVLHQSLAMTSRALHKRTFLTQKLHVLERTYNAQKHSLREWKQFVAKNLSTLQQWWKRFMECDVRIRDYKTRVLQKRAPTEVTSSFMRDMIAMFSELQYGTQEWINASQLCQIYASSQYSVPHILPYQRLFADMFHFHPERTFINLHTTGTQVIDTIIYSILKTWYYTVRSRAEKSKHDLKTKDGKQGYHREARMGFVEGKTSFHDEDPEWVDAFILIPQIERIAHWEAKMHMHVNAFNPWSDKKQEDNQIQLLYDRLVNANDDPVAQSAAGSSVRTDRKSSPQFVLTACHRFHHTVILEYQGGFRCILHPFTSGISKKLMAYLNDSWRVSQQERFRSTYWRTSGSVHASFPCMALWKHPVYQKFACEYPFQFQLLVQAWKEELSYDKTHVRTSLPAPTRGSIVIVDQVWHVFDMSTVGRDVKASMAANAWYRTLLLRKETQAAVFPSWSKTPAQLGVIFCNDTLYMHNQYPLAHWMRIIQLLLIAQTTSQRFYLPPSPDWPRFHIWKIPQKSQSPEIKTCIDYIMRAEETFCRDYFFAADGTWRIDKKLQLQEMTTGYVSHYDNGKDMAVIPVANADIANAFYVAAISYATADASTIRIRSSSSVTQQQLVANKPTVEREILFVPLQNDVTALKAYNDARSVEKKRQSTSSSSSSSFSSSSSSSQLPSPLIDELYTEHHPLSLQRGWGTKMPYTASEASPLKLRVLEKKLSALNSIKHLITSCTRRPEYCRDALERHFRGLEPVWTVINIQNTVAFLHNTVAATFPTTDPDDERLSECVELWYALHSRQERILCIGFRLLRDKMEHTWTGNDLAFVTSFQIALFNDARNHTGHYIRAIYLDTRALSPLPLTNTYCMHELEPPIVGEGKMQVIASSINALCSMTQLQGNQWDITMKDVSQSPLIFTYVSTLQNYERIQCVWNAQMNIAHVRLSVPVSNDWTTEERVLLHLMDLSYASSNPAQSKLDTSHGLVIASAIRSVAADCLHHKSYHKALDPNFQCVLPSVRGYIHQGSHSSSSSSSSAAADASTSSKTAPLYKSDAIMICLINSVRNDHIYIKVAGPYQHTRYYHIQQNISGATDEADFSRFAQDTQYTKREILLATGTGPLLLVHELQLLFSQAGVYNQANDEYIDDDIKELRNHLWASTNLHAKQNPTTTQYANSYHALQQLLLMCSERDQLLESDFLSFLDEHWFVNDNLLMRIYTELLPVHKNWLQQVMKTDVLPSLPKQAHSIFKQYIEVSLQYLGAQEQQRRIKSSIHEVLESIASSPFFVQDTKFELQWNRIVPMYATLAQGTNPNLSSDVYS